MFFLQLSHSIVAVCVAVCGSISNHFLNIVPLLPLSLGYWRSEISSETAFSPQTVGTDCNATQLINDA